jgi:hypothetical protein
MKSNWTATAVLLAGTHTAQPTMQRRFACLLARLTADIKPQYWMVSNRRSI